MDQDLTLHNRDTKLPSCPDLSMPNCTSSCVPIVIHFAPNVSRSDYWSNTSIFPAFCTFNMSKLDVNSSYLQKLHRILHDDKMSSINDIRSGNLNTVFSKDTSSSIAPSFAAVAFVMFAASTQLHP